MKTLNINMWIAWHLPKKILLWSIIRGFADATSGENSNKFIGDIRYKDVYDAVVIKYKINDHNL
jgi:hypothetical protein